jgi:hypothetical protein
MPDAGRELPPYFVTHSVSLAPGCERRFEPGEWADAIVVVEQGEIELECLGGTCSRFATGSLLCFESLPLRTLRNAGSEPALLIAVSRRSDESSPGAASHE